MTLSIKTKLSEPLSGTANRSSRTQYWVSDGSPWYPGQPGVYPPDLFSSGSYSFAGQPSLSYIELKDSINSLLSISAEEQILIEFRRSSPALIKKRPKRPVYNPPKFRKLRLPELKRYDQTIYEITPPRRRSASSEKKIAAAVKRREKLIKRLNLAEKLRYDRRLRELSRIVQRRLERRLSYDTAFKRRLVNYERRLMLWERSLASLKARIATRVRLRDRYKQDHPYRKAILTNLSPGQPIYSASSWDAARPINPYPGERWGVNWWTRIEPLFGITSANANAKAEVVAETLFNALRSCAATYDPILVPRLFDKLANEKVNVGNFIAERSQTASLLRDSIKALAQFISGKKKVMRSLAELGSSPKRISDEYLKFQFGVKPLLSDYETALAALASSSDSLDVKVRAVQKRIPISTTSNGYGISGIMEVRYVLRYKVDNQLFQQLNQWGMVNPLSIGWEMTPWSFIVDWFYPVGDIISASLADAGLVFDGGTKSISFQGTFTSLGSVDSTEYRDKPSPPGATYHYMGDWAGRIKIRDVLTAPPVFEVPPFKNPLSWTHGFESLALLIQKMR